MKLLENKRYIPLARASTPRQEGKTSHERQLRQIYRFADLGICVFEIRDTVSGLKSERKSLDELLKKIKAKQIPKPDFVLVEKWSRWMRNLLSALEYIDKFAALGVEVNAIFEWIEKDNPMRKMLLGMYLGRAQDQSKIISDNIASGMHLLRSQGFHRASVPPACYEKKFSEQYQVNIETPNGTTSIELKKALLELNEGVLTQAEIFTKREKDLKLSRSVFYFACKNQFYAGYVWLIPYRGSKGKWIPAKHKALISPKVFFENQKIIKSRARQTIKSKKDDRFVLIGLLYCSISGWKMTGSTTTKKRKGRGCKIRYHYYHIRSSKEKIRGQRYQVKQANEIISNCLKKFKLPLDKYNKAEQAIKKRVSTITSNRKQNEKKILARIEEVERHKKAIKKKYAIDEISVSEYREFNGSFESELKLLDSDLNDISLKKLEYEQIIKKVLSLVVNIHRLYNESSTENKRRILTAFFPDGFYLNLEKGTVEPRRVNKNIVELFGSQTIKTIFPQSEPINLQHVRGGDPAQTKVEKNHDLSLLISLIAS